MEELHTADAQPNSRKLKKLYGKVKKQMEFYFSDSNLAKDKFLKDLISKDPDGWVDLEIFRKFNKIRALTKSCEIIAASLERSDVFELSKDNKRIRRVTPLELSKDFDACTLYVEKLPHNADQKWIKDVLGHFGCITYVNVPRFKTTNKIKGFAFVEFETPESVKSACEFYKTLPVKESSASEDESKNTKNAKKHKYEEGGSDKKFKKSRTRSVSESSDKVTDIVTVKNEHQEIAEKDSENDQDPSHQENKRKRKLENSDDEVPVKKAKESVNDDQNTSVPETNNESKTVESDMQLSDIPEDVSAQSNEQVSMEELKTELSNSHLNGTKIEETKGKRKRKNSKKHRSNVERPILRVMPKSEWKAYRNKYLELQRSTMSLLKKQILLETQELKEQETNVKLDVCETKKSLQFTPGVIIKVKLSEPVKNSSEIKTQVKANAVVAYVDAPVESSEIFIRCHNSEDALAITKEDKLVQIGEAQLITGDEEKKYWEKIESDRKNKFNSPVIHKKRGRDKLLVKAAKLEEMKNKHIYFDD